MTPKLKNFLEKLLTGQLSDEDYDAVANEMSDVDLDTIFLESLAEIESEEANQPDSNVEVHYLGDGRGWVLPRKHTLKN